MFFESKDKIAIDTGNYHFDGDHYTRLVEELYAKYPNGVTLPPEYAAHVHEDLSRLLIFLSRYKFVTRLFKKSDHVLEIGSGSGLGSIFLAQHCTKLTSIDVRTTAIEEAQKLNSLSNIEFKVADFFETSFENKFDAIVALDVIEHMPLEKGEELLLKIKQHLNNSGVAIIGSPSIYSYPYQSPLSKASHIKCYDRDELLEVMNKYFGRTMCFSMNDEVVHTGFAKMAWYYFALGFSPQDNVEKELSL